MRKVKCLLRDKTMRQSFSFAIFYILLYVTPTTAQYTEIAQWPGWSDLQGCVQTALYYGLPRAVDCGDWKCVCENLDVATISNSFLASSECSGRQQDIAAETSVLDGFCSQYPGITTVAAVVTATPPVATPAPGINTVFITTTVVSSQVVTTTVVSVSSTTIRVIVSVTPTGSLSFFNLIVVMAVPTTYTTTFTGTDGELTSSVIVTSANVPVVVESAGLSKTDKTGLGVGLGLGIPVLLIACAIIFGSKRRRQPVNQEPNRNDEWPTAAMDQTPYAGKY